MRDGRDPRVALLDAVGSADAFFREGKLRLLAGESFTPDELDRHLQHLTRLAALAKVAVDARLVDAVTAQHILAGEQAAGLLLGVAAALVDALDLAPVRRRALLEWARAHLIAQLARIEHPDREIALPPPPADRSDRRAAEPVPAVRSPEPVQPEREPAAREPEAVPSDEAPTALGQDGTDDLRAADEKDGASWAKVIAMRSPGARSLLPRSGA